MFRSAILAAVAAAADGVTDYTQNGANWGSSAEAFKLCDAGREQSPINLTTTGTSTSRDMEINGYGYKDATVAQSAVSRTKVKVQAPVSDGEFHLHFADGSMSVFSPAQFHFHAPSEHAVDGKLYDLEVHFVHTYADTNGMLGGVIGVFFDVEEGGDYPNAFLDAVWNEAGTDVKIPVASFLAGVDMTEYWNYNGSLTTPPCTEGIKWTVIKDVQPISRAQLEKFTSLWADDTTFAEGKGNNRVVQPLNERTLYFNGAMSSLSTAAVAIATVAALTF